MTRFDIFIVAYSLLLLIGGVTGYVLKASVASLLMSSIFAILLIAALFLIRMAPSYGYRMVKTLLSLLFLFFCYRWFMTQFFPAGLLCLLSLAVLVTSIFLQPKDKTG